MTGFDLRMKLTIQTKSNNTQDDWDMPEKW